MKNIVLNTDSYKVSMFNQYPKNTQAVYSYVEARKGDYSHTVFFGLQAFIKKYLTVRVTHADVDEAKKMWTAHGMPFNEAGWRYIVDTHQGRLPVKIRALREGVKVPVGVPLVTIENTDPECFWLTTWLETALLRAIWYPTTVATVSSSIRDTIKQALEKTGDVDSLPFKLHDFGARGASSEETAAIGGAAHLLNFDGTDTMSGIMFLREFYGADMPGFSIPATEHSTITSWGRENEAEAYRNMLNQYSSNGIFACVSDSYDIFNAAENIWGGDLRDEVIASGATVVVRPDSGDPVTVVGRVIELLGKQFGFTTNEKGYKVLNNVRVIQGDGVNPESIRAIIESLIESGWSIDNIAFGMGGALLQKVDRDTLSFALKCSAINIGGEWFDVKKDPVTDSGKKSKAGRVVAVVKDGEYASSVRGVGVNAMRTVFADGELLLETGLEAIRSLARA